jgi:hypothetical protein
MLVNSTRGLNEKLPAERETISSRVKREALQREVRLTGLARIPSGRRGTRQPVAAHR